MDSSFGVSGPLWEEAKRIFYDNVGEVKGAKMTDMTTLTDTMDSLKLASTKASKEYGEHSVRKDKKPIITIKLGRIMKRLEVFMKIGDAYMGCAPETVSLVWMAFRMIFTGFMKDAATCEFLTDAVDQLTDIMFICSVFEKRYLNANDTLDTVKAIKDRILAQIPPLYAVVLKFSFESRKLFAHGKLTRSFMSWRSVELEESLNDAQRKRNTLQDTAGIGFQEAALDALQGIQFDASLIRDISETVQSEIVPGIKNIQAEQVQSKERHNVEDIQKRFKEQSEWLKTGPIAGIASAGRIQNINKGKIHPGSADWVLKSTNFETWRDSPGGTLSWLWGNGGFGKSFLISSMIEHLESKDRVWPTTKPHVIYFFCRKGDEAYSVGKRIFLHLLIQLYEKAAPGNPGSTIELQDKCSRVVEDVWKQTKSLDKHDSTLVKMKSALLPMFKDLVKALGTDVFVLVDGLDECDDLGDDFLQCLLELPDDSNVHMMISSRPDTYLGLPDPIPLNIEVTAVQTKEPILECVKSRIREIGWLKGKERQKERMRACKRISEKSDGSFRYAEVVLESLSQPQSTPFNVLLKNLPNGMNDLYRQSLASLDPHLRKVLIVALRWLMCSSGQVAVDLIAEELECRWDIVEEDERDEDENDDDDDDLDDYADLESESEASGPTLRSVPEPTPFARDIARELRIAGRDFLVFDGPFIDTQHNSIRDFVLAEEERIKHETEHCPECRSRFQETIAYEAGPKEGNFIICRTILQRLNNTAFQNEHIIGDKTKRKHHISVNSNTSDRQERSDPVEDASDVADDVAKIVPDEPENLVQPVSSIPGKPIQDVPGISDDPAEDTSDMPEIPDDHVVLSKEDMIEALRGSGQHTEERTQSQFDERNPPRSQAKTLSSGVTVSNYEGPPERVRYELLHWPQHFRQLEQITDHEVKQSEKWKKLYDDLEKFLQRDSEAYQWWLKKAHPWRKFKTFDSPHIITARYGLLDLLERQMRDGTYDVNESNERKDTALHLACTDDGEHRCIKLLCELGADVNARNDDGATPLLMLIRHRGSMENFNILLEHGAKADIADSNGLTPLHLAAESSNLEMCQKILQCDGVDANAKETVYGETSLHAAFKLSDPSTELLELLIANGANVNEQDNDSQAPLYEACNVGDANAAAVLLRHGADIDDDENVFGHTALHAAISAQSLAAVRVLIDAGADLTLQNKSGQGALHQSIIVGHFEIFEVIIEALVEKDLFKRQCLQHDTLDSFTPLHCACHHGDFDMTKILLEKGDTAQMVLEKDRRGDIALHIAADKSLAAISLLLIHAGSNPIEKNNFNLTPLGLAINAWTHGPPLELPTENMVETVLVLIDKVPEAAEQPELISVDIETEMKTPICSIYKHLRNLPDEHGWTPLALARQLKRPYKIDLLLEGDEEEHMLEVIGQCPSEMDALSLLNYPNKEVKFSVSKDKLEVSTFIKDLLPDDKDDPLAQRPDIGTAVMSNHPAPACMPVYYFEVEIIAAPPYLQLFVGLVYQNTARANRFDVHAWETESNLENEPEAALYSNRRQPDPLPEEYKVGFKQGDVVGCGFDFENEVVFYTRNGERLPPAFFQMRGRLFPVVGLLSYEIHVRVNFGNDPAIPFKCQTWADIPTSHSDIKKELDGLPTNGPLDLPWDTPAFNVFPEASGLRMAGFKIHDPKLIERGCWEVPELTLKSVRDVVAGHTKPRTSTLAW